MSENIDSTLEDEGQADEVETVEEIQEEKTENLSVRESIAADMKKLYNEQQSPDPEPESSLQEDQPEEESEPEEEEFSDPEWEEEVSITESDDETQVEVATDEDESKYPQFWSREERKGFDKLPPELQDLILKKEKKASKQVSKRFQEVANIKKSHDRIERAFEPFSAQLRQSGLTVAEGVDHLIKQYSHSMTDPVNFIVGLAQERGVDLVDLVKGEAQAKGVDFDDYVYGTYDKQKAQPQVQAHNPVLEQRLNHIETQMYAAEAQKSNQVAFEFLNEKNADGSPKYPHVDQVIPQMLDYLNVKKQNGALQPSKEILQEAYETAIYSNPELREELLRQRDQQVVSKFKSKSQDNIAKAKRSRTRIKSSGAIPNVPAKKLTVREEMLEMYKQQQ